jgi:hypothetical protein
LEWEPVGKPTDVNTYDFPNKEKGKACPYGVYDLTRNEGWVSVGISRDTAQFAVESIGGGGMKWAVSDIPKQAGC